MERAKFIQQQLSLRIIQRWDGQGPCLNWILRDFRRYLIQKKIKPEKKRVTIVYSTNWDKRMPTANKIFDVKDEVFKAMFDLLPEIKYFRYLLKIHEIRDENILRYYIPKISVVFHVS